MSLHEPAAMRHRRTPTIGSAAGHVTPPRALERTSVDALFEQYEALVDANGPDDEKHALAQRICALLSACEQNEAKRYDGVARVTSDARNEAANGTVPTATAQELIERIRLMDVDDWRTARRAPGRLDGA